MGFLPVLLNLTRKEWLMTQRLINPMALITFAQSKGWRWDTDSIVCYDFYRVGSETLPVWDEEDNDKLCEPYASTFTCIYFDDEKEEPNFVAETKKTFEAWIRKEQGS